MRRKDFSLQEAVRDAEAWQISLLLPAPLSHRLDGLVDCAVDAGEARTLSRTELLCSLICTAPEDGTTLRGNLERFRLAKVRDVVLSRDNLPSGANVISLEARRPGRKAR